MGCGLAGLSVAIEFTNGGIKPIMFEKSTAIAGVWRWQGNAHSRVNSSEPGYRLVLKRDNNSKIMTNHSFHFEILDDCRLAIV